MSRWKSKACPRCSGDMFVDRDLESWYEQCLQCSYRIELKPMPAIKAQEAPTAKERRKRIKVAEPQHTT